MEVTRVELETLIVELVFFADVVGVDDDSFEIGAPLTTETAFLVELVIDLVDDVDGFKIGAPLITEPAFFDELVVLLEDFTIFPLLDSRAVLLSFFDVVLEDAFRRTSIVLMVVDPVLWSEEARRSACVSASFSASILVAESEDQAA